MARSTTDVILTSLLNFITGIMLFITLVPLLKWGVWNATWLGLGRQSCLVQDGACWAMVIDRLPMLLYGYYPEVHIWRIEIVLTIIVIGVCWLIHKIYKTQRNLTFTSWEGVSCGITLVVCTWLLYGGFGLPLVDTSKWGGLMLTVFLFIIGSIGASFLAIFLALGRTQTTMPLLRWLCTGWIELFRGVPFITVLFMASVMLPLFLPPDIIVNKLVRIIIGLIIFQSAYLAEVLRGGLQATSPTQTEACIALGMGYWKTQRYVILPQAIRHVIPGITSITIGILKETTLVLMVGMSDFLASIELMIRDSHWSTPQSAPTGYVFAGIIYFLICGGISQISYQIGNFSSKNQKV